LKFFRQTLIEFFSSDFDEKFSSAIPIAIENRSGKIRDRFSEKIRSAIF